MTQKLFGEHLPTWDYYAAAALAGAIQNGRSPQEAAVLAADAADSLLAERKKRTDAGVAHITSKS